MPKALILIFLCMIINSCNCKLNKLPSTFKFGSATSSYQIEGGWDKHGKGLSIWDNFVHTYPDKILGHATGDIAANSYYRFDDDIKAIIELGLDFYRFSISWTRILPNGDLSNINEVGIKYYNMIIDKLVANGVQPMITMFHFDTPQTIEDNGGFLNISIINNFNSYADVLFKNFGDRVKYWITFNEAYEFCVLSYGVGLLPPLIKNHGISEYQCMENILKAHAKVYLLFKTKYKHFGGKISICLQSRFFYDDNKNLTELAMNYQFGVMAQPIYGMFGGYPDIILKYLEENAIKKGLIEPSLKQLNFEWKGIIKGSADFLALNYYTSALLVPSNESRFIFVPDGYDMAFDPRWKQSIFAHNHDVPKGLEDVLKWIRKNYGNIEIIITENGWGDKGDMNDIDRIEYYEGHLNAVLNAINEGSNVTGYAAWSLIDNFEWFFGYEHKYGLYKVDFNDPNQPRIPKASAKFYKNFITDIKSNANSIKKSFMLFLIMRIVNKIC